MDLHRDFAEFLQCMISRRARFVVVGAHALAAHGRPRYTGDLDVLIDPTAANAARVLRALADFGFASVDLSVDDLSAAGRVVQLGFPPVRIDILTSISGVTFRRAWAGRVTLALAGVNVAFLGRDQLVENKRASGRTKDLLDIALLEEAEPQPPSGPRPAPRTPKRR